MYIYFLNVRRCFISKIFKNLRFFSLYFTVINGNVPLKREVKSYTHDFYEILCSFGNIPYKCARSKSIFGQVKVYMYSS